MYEDFAKWLDSVLERCLQVDAVALNFNIYEEEDSEWSIQLVATASYTEENDDWACDEVYSSEEDLYYWKNEADWTEVYEQVVDFVNEYFEKGKYIEELKRYEAIGIGFVDGDIGVVFQKNQ